MCIRWWVLIIPSYFPISLRWHGVFELMVPLQWPSDPQILVQFSLHLILTIKMTVQCFIIQCRHMFLALPNSSVTGNTTLSSQQVSKLMSGMVIIWVSRQAERLRSKLCPRHKSDCSHTISFSTLNGWSQFITVTHNGKQKNVKCSIRIQWLTVP